MIFVLLKSFLLGLVFTLPLGPIGVLCVRKILQFGRLHGFFLGLAQVFIVFAYSIVATLSLGWFSEFITQYQFLLRLIGGLVLIVFGIKIFFSKNSVVRRKTICKKTFIADFFSMVGLMLISPHTLLVFLAFFAALDLYKVATFFQHMEVIFGILIGSIFSWGLVCICFVGYKTKTSQKLMSWINRSAGVLLLCFGIAVCISAGIPK